MEKLDQIIDKYCGSIEERVAACRDKKVAEYLKQNICLEVKRHVNNESILNDLENYIDNLIDAGFSGVKSKGDKMKRIEKNISIEELIAKYPFPVNILQKKGIKFIVYVAPIWGMLEDGI